MDIPDKVRQWKLGPAGGNVMSWNNYQHNNGAYLMNTETNNYLTYKEVPLGINLGFIANQEYKTHFRLPDGTERDILSGELVALGIGGGKAFLQYAHRDFGVNLEWVQNPNFQWRIFGPTEGAPIPYDAPVAIVNDKVEPAPDFFIHFDRPPGMADVGWTTSPGFWDSVEDVAVQVGIKAAKAAIAAL
jgi:hypothetical protein